MIKTFLYVSGATALLIYGFVKLGKYLGRKTTPPDWEPMNSDEDQSKNMFV